MTIVTKESKRERMTKATVSKTVSEDTAVKADCGPKAESEVTEKRAYSGRASVSEETEKLASSTPQAFETEKQSDSGPDVAPEKAEKKAHVTEIRRQLLESSKRLSQANSKLEGLVRASHEVEDGSSKFSSRDSYVRTVMVSSNGDESDNLHGSMAYDSESEGIEVLGCQFADV